MNNLQSIGVGMIVFAGFVVIQFCAGYVAGKNVTVGTTNILVCGLAAVGSYFLVHHT